MVWGLTVGTGSGLSRGGERGKIGTTVIEKQNTIISLYIKFW